MAKAKVDDHADRQRTISNTHVGKPNILTAPTRQKSGKKMILVRIMKLATGLFSFFFLFI